MATTVCATLSAIVGTPSIQTPPPCGLGISTALTAGGRRTPSSSDSRSLRSASNSSRSTSSTPGAPLLALTCRHASQTISLGIANDFSFGPGMLLRLLPEPTAPVERIDIPDQPAPSLHPHPSKQGSLSYYGPVRQRAPQLVLNASGFRRWHAPSRNPWRPTTPGRRFRRSPSHVPGQSRRPGSRRLHAGHHRASHRAPARLVTGEQPDPPLSMPPRFC